MSAQENVAGVLGRSNKGYEAKQRRGHAHAYTLAEDPCNKPASARHPRMQHSHRTAIVAIYAQGPGHMTTCPRLCKPRAKVHCLRDVISPLTSARLTFGHTMRCHALSSSRCSLSWHAPTLLEVCSLTAHACQGYKSHTCYCLRAMTRQGQRCISSASYEGTFSLK